MHGTVQHVERLYRPCSLRIFMQSGLTTFAAIRI